MRSNLSHGAAALALGGLFFVQLLSSAVAAEAGDPLLAALQGALTKNVEHAREWLDAKDYKSVAQAAGGLKMLGQLLRARSDDPSWQAATGKVLAAASDLQAAAGSADAPKIQTSLDGLEKVVAAVAALQPTGQPQSLPQIAGVRPLMLLLDSVYADAKVAVLTGNTAAAKKQAYVLSELGRVVSNSQSGKGQSRERWPELSGALVEASLAAAKSPAEDVATVRQLLRNISQKCEACHETRER